jgi:hypothetical protein
LTSTLGLVPEVQAQYTPGPYSNYNYNWNYYGPVNYRYGMTRYGMPGLGVSPWDPMVQAQLNMSRKMARTQMYGAVSEQASSAANLFNQQAIAQAMQNAQQQQAVPPRYDVRSRAPSPVPDSAGQAPKPLPRNQVLRNDGQVIWPSSASADGELGQARAAAQAAIGVAVEEFEADGKATIQSVAEAKSLLFAYGKPVLDQVGRKNRTEARKLLTFFQSLERVLDTLAGE